MLRLCTHSIDSVLTMCILKIVLPQFTTLCIEYMYFSGHFQTPLLYMDWKID